MIKEQTKSNQRAIREQSESNQKAIKEQSESNQRALREFFRMSNSFFSDLLIQCKWRISIFNILGKCEEEGSNVVEVEVNPVEIGE